mmetsp:Transcript_19327/g.61266  ORF Transcript_19327/g.61266 Transcript_19327/m.61266 type:complete len:293 (+) Transcript_19327:396-1274(+)
MMLSSGNRKTRLSVARRRRNSLAFCPARLGAGTWVQSDETERSALARGGEELLLRRKPAAHRRQPARLGLPPFWPHSHLLVLPLHQPHLRMLRWTQPDRHHPWGGQLPEREGHCCPRTGRAARRGRAPPRLLAGERVPPRAGAGRLGRTLPLHLVKAGSSSALADGLAPMRCGEKAGRQAAGWTTLHRHSLHARTSHALLRHHLHLWQAGPPLSSRRRGQERQAAAHRGLWVHGLPHPHPPPHLAPANETGESLQETRAGQGRHHGPSPVRRPPSAAAAAAGSKTRAHRCQC